MIEDIRTVMWKEWKGLFRQRGSRMRAVLTLLTPIAIFGLWFPFESQANWFVRADSLFAAFAIPLMVGLLTVPDSFAGERERHTLPTLLASRLPDRAILFGKAGFAVALSLGLTLIVLAMGLAIANIVSWSGTIQLYSAKIALADLSFCLLVAILTAGVGILLSLRSVTVQEAQQTLAAVLLLPPTLLGPILLLITETKPEWSPKAILGQVSPTRIFLFVAAILLVLDLLLLALTMARFQRARLISN